MSTAQTDLVPPGVIRAHVLGEIEPAAAAHAQPLCKIPSEVWAACRNTHDVLYGCTKPKDGRFEVHLLHFLV